MLDWCLGPPPPGMGWEVILVGSGTMLYSLYESGSYPFSMFWND